MKEEINENVWTSKKIIALAEFYERNEHMWKKGSLQYYNREEKIRTNGEIGKQLGYSVDEVKKKWISLRQIFMKELSAKRKNGHSKKKEWRYFNLLFFLSSEAGHLDQNEAVDSDDPLGSIQDSESLDSHSTTTLPTPTKKRKTNLIDSPQSIVANPIYNKKCKKLTKEDDYEEFGVQIANDMRRIKSKDENVCIQLEIEIRELVLKAFKKTFSKS